MKIGNWIVDDQGITWDGTEVNGYNIPAESISDLGMGERANMYDWLVHLSDKTWATHDDIITLNIAFVYALGYFKHEFNIASYNAAINEQSK